MSNTQPSHPLPQSVLIVDDSDVQRAFAVSVCEDLGVAQVLEASDGRQALSLLTTLEPPPQVVMLDLRMPEMDGVEFIQMLGKHNLKIPVIIASSRDASLVRSVETMTQMLGQPILGVLQKPFTHQELAGVIARFNPISHVTSIAKRRPEIRAFTEEDLLQAISDNQLVPYFQPKVDVATAVVKGVEALARWIHPKFGLIPPDRFISLAEKNDATINLLTRVIAAKAVEQTAEWKKMGVKLNCAINLSARLLSSPAFFFEIAELPERFALEPDQITWEVTESAVSDNIAEAVGSLARLRLRAFGVSIDDYGTGFSSMQQLARMPFSELKIDRSFVNGASKQQNLAVILKSAIEMAQGLNLESVAEGVETLEDWVLLQQLGCTTAQGFLIAKPMPADHFLPWLDNFNRKLRPTLLNRF